MSIFLYSLPGLFWNRLFVFFQNWLFADLYCTTYFQSQVNKYVMFFFLSLYLESFKPVIFLVLNIDNAVLPY
jgi:hypothetical protein